MNMYISSMTHRLNNEGDIMMNLSQEARELTEFLTRIIEYTTISLPVTLTSTNVRCVNKGCFGLIKSAVKPNSDVIHWYCPICEDEGEIKHWHSTKWNKHIR